MSGTSITFGDKLHGVLSGEGRRGAIIITHGAGSGMDSPILVKTATQLAERGFAVMRFNFSYLGNRPAPSMGGKNEQPELVAAIDYIKKEFGSPILVGKSFGARVNSYVAAERDDIPALVFYGLPLQGMSKNSKPRDWSHLSRFKGDILFITGDKDKLCPLDQLVEVQKKITTNYVSEIVLGDHSFKPKSEDAAIKLCVEWVDGLRTTNDSQVKARV